MLASLRRLLLIAFLGALALPGALPVRADDEDPEEIPREVPVDIAAEVDATEAEDLGRWTLRLTFTPREDVRRAYRVELRLYHGRYQVLKLDHSPDTPTTRWRKGEPVSWEVPVPVPFEAGLEADDRLEVLVGFFDPDAEQSVRPYSENYLQDGRLKVAELVVPSLGPTDGAEVLTRILDRAKALAAEEGRKPDAFRALEQGLRRAKEDATKERFRDALLGLGHFDARPLSLLERQTVQHRIGEEKRRYLRKMSGRFFDQGKLYAALRILELIGGSLAEESDSAVIGALAEANRAQKDIQQLQVRLLARITDEEKAEARKALERLGPTEKLLVHAELLFEKRQYPVARYLLRELSLVSDRDLATLARTRLDALDAAWLAATPPDEAVLVEESKTHPAFDRLATVVTHQFVFIGPKTLVENIPERSKLRYDVAYIFLTDLFGRVPNPGGSRISVFWKELWDFGGGQASGNRIDIGRADPAARGYRVDTGLLYHELTHCVDDTTPIFAGWREGLANMGAAYSFEALGQKGDELHAFDSNLRAFREDYLGRDLEYWRIPGYGPSAGFLLHFLDAHSKRGRGHDWKPYRTFFRAYRDSPMKDGREPYVARAFAYFLMKAFGTVVFDDLLSFRFPLVASDREAVTLEVETFVKGEYTLARSGPDFASFENSPLPRDLVARNMLSLHRSGNRAAEVRRIARDQLGILHDWWVIGPFRAKGADPRLHVFAPEKEIEFAKEYADDFNVCKWRRAGEGPVVTVEPTGWVSFRFSYQDNTATYALTHVTVPKAVEAFAHVRSDDDFTLFVNDDLVGGYRNRGSNGSAWLWWRGPAQRVPDAMRLPLSLRAGRNKVLVKVKNRTGGAGFVLALSRRDGGPIGGMTTDLEAVDPAAKTKERRSWKTVVRHVFRTKSVSGVLEKAVGDFKVVNRRLVGQSTGKGVGWRPYTVRPGFPKDSPSNLAWLKDKHTKGIDALRLTMELVPKGGGVPKLVVTFQGEGGTDGLSGWNLILHPQRKKNLGARLERYDRAVYQTHGLEPPGGEVQRLVLEYVNERVTVRLGDLVLFENVPVAPIPDRRRIGFCTFGPGLGIASFRLETLK